MKTVPPASPQFGDCLPLKPEPEVLRFLARRRSASALTLQAPGPDEDEVASILRLAARVPDHGKLGPWRFILMEGEAKAAAGQKLAAIAAGRADAPKATAALGKFNNPPTAIAVISKVVDGQIPEWEQIMSAGAVCLTALNAATAMGYGANWITDWYAYDEAALEVFGVTEGEKVAGFIFIGTPLDSPLERVRPELEPRIRRL